MKITHIILACSFLLAPFVTISAAHAQEPVPASAEAPKIALLNPHEELVKSIKATEMQKQQLANVDAAVGSQVQEVFGALAAYVGTLRVKLAITPKYMARVAEAEKLPGEEMIEAKKAIWADIAKEIAPDVEKETLKQMRATMLTYFKKAEPILTAAQKPALKATRTRVEKNMDKELPALAKVVAGKILEESIPS